MPVLPCPHCQVPIFPGEIAAGVCPVCKLSLNPDAPPEEAAVPPVPQPPSPHPALAPGACGRHPVFRSILTVAGVVGVAANCFWLLLGARGHQDSSQPGPKPETILVAAPKPPVLSLPVPKPVALAANHTNGPEFPEPRASVETRESKIEERELKNTPAVAPMPPPDSIRVRDGSDLIPDLLKLAGMPGLREVDLANTQLTNQDLVFLKNLTELRTLSLRGTKVTGPGLEQLGSLTDLDLSDTPIMDKGLASLEKLAQLRKLVLVGTKVTGPGFTELAGLESLDLSLSQMTDPGLKYLGHLSDLRELRLAGTYVHGPGLEHLQGLHRLDLADCPVNDKGLQCLHGLKQLRWLDLSRTMVTDAGVRTLQARLPALEIIR